MQYILKIRNTCLQLQFNTNSKFTQHTTSMQRIKKLYTEQTIRSIQLVNFTHWTPWSKQTNKWEKQQTNFKVIRKKWWTITENIYNLFRLKEGDREKKHSKFLEGNGNSHQHQEKVKGGLQLIHWIVVTNIAAATSEESVRKESEERVRKNMFRTLREKKLSPYEHKKVSTSKQ
jgi:fibrillarin-like rRNA methylase